MPDSPRVRLLLTGFAAGFTVLAAACSAEPPATQTAPIAAPATPPGTPA